MEQMQSQSQSEAKSLHRTDSVESNLDGMHTLLNGLNKRAELILTKLAGHVLPKSNEEKQPTDVVSLGKSNFEQMMKLSDTINAIHEHLFIN